MKIVKIAPTTLAAPFASGDTSFTLSSLIDSKGNTVALASIGTFMVVVLKQGSTTEMVKVSAIVQNADGSATLTVASSGRDIDPTSPYAGHATGEDFQTGADALVTNDPLSMSTFASLVEDQTFSGANTFTGKLGVGAVTSSDTGKAATVDFVNSVAIAGASNASTTVKGIVEEATQAEVDARTAAGGTGAELYINPATLRATKYSDPLASTGSANAYVLTPTPALTAYATGQVLSFIANFSNSGAVTLNVSGLGAKAIKKQDGATALASGDIVSGQAVIVEYDGTNFQMLSPVAPAPLLPAGSGASLTGITASQVGALSICKNGTTTKNAADSSTTQTIAHGLGVTPKSVSIYAAAVSTLVANTIAVSQTVYNGTTQSSVSAIADTGPALTMFTDFRLHAGNATGAGQVGVVTFDATNITITWTKNGSPTGTYDLLWTAIA